MLGHFPAWMPPLREMLTCFSSSDLVISSLSWTVARVARISGLEEPIPTWGQINSLVAADTWTRVAHGVPPRFLLEHLLQETFGSSSSGQKDCVVPW